MTDTISIPSDPATLHALAKYWQACAKYPDIADPQNGRYLSPKEIIAFLLASCIDDDPVGATLLACVLLSGIPADLLAVAEWANDDMTAVAIAVPKFNREQVGALSKATMERMRQIASLGDGYSVFLCDGHLVTPDTLAITLRRVAQRAGTPNLTLDDLQRTHDYIAVCNGLI